MARYIDADSAKAIYLSKSAGEQLDRVPTADVAKVVRCKDCKNNNKGYCKRFQSVFCENAYFVKVKPDDFCSSGAEMDGEGYAYGKYESEEEK